MSSPSHPRETLVRGFTLIELMIASSVLAIFAAMLLGLASQAGREQRLTDAYLRDLTECRRALASIEADLRSASRAASTADGFEITTTAGAVRYSLRERSLTRSTLSIPERRLAACIDRITFERGDPASLVTVGLTVSPRSHAAPRRAHTFSTSVHLRNWRSR